MNGRCHLRASRPPRAFTLLELILALALMAIITGLMVQAVAIHVRALDARRNYAEESQLAHAILSRIAHDLQNIPTLHPMDVSSIEAMMADTDPSSALGESAGESGALAEEMPDVEELLDESETNPNTQGISESETIPDEPGLYGNQFELQVDVARVPRIDEYQVVAPSSPGALRDIPSEIKTVAYFVRSQGLGGIAPGFNGANATTTPNSGLIRRSLSRAVTQWASQSASVSALQEFETVWAPEVLAIEFHYFDGTDWVYEWDSSEQSLPRAVEIILTMRPAARLAGPVLSTNPTVDQTESTSVRIYRRVVWLPQVHQPVPDGEEDGTEMEALGL